LKFSVFLKQNKTNKTKNSLFFSKKKPYFCALTHIFIFLLVAVKKPILSKKTLKTQKNQQTKPKKNKKN